MSIIHQLNEISSVYANWIWLSAWQSAILGVAILLVVRFCARIPVSIRYALLLLAIIKFVVPPGYALPVGLFSHMDANSVVREFAQPNLADSLRTGEVDVAIAAQVSEFAQQQTYDSNRDPAANSLTTIAPAIAPDATERLSPASCFLMFHLVGTFAFLGWISSQFYKLHCLVRTSQAIDASSLFGHDFAIKNLLRGIRLQQNPNAHCPMAFGVIRPTIMLPSSLVESDPSRLRAIVLHEVAHIRRRDILARWLEIPVLAVWWFHPILWILSRSISNVREDCCDDFSVDSGATNEYEYCQTLLHVAQHVVSSQGTRLSCGINDSHPVARRITRLMNPNRAKASRLGVLGLVSIMAVAVCVLPGLNTAQVANAQQGNDGAHVFARSGSFRQGMKSVRTNPQGNFAFDSLSVDVQFDVFHSDYPNTGTKPLTVGMPFELIINANGYERLVVPRAVAAKAQDAQDLSISMTAKVHHDPYSLKVEFRDADGDPIPNAQLRLIVSTNQPISRNDNRFNWALIDSEQLGQKSYVEQFLTGITDANGKVEFKDVIPGKYLQLAYWGERLHKGRSLAFDETRSGESDSVVINVPRPAVVRGTVDREKFPDAASFRISSINGLEFKTDLAKDQSRFELTNLPPGIYTVAVDSKRQRFTENGHVMSGSKMLAYKRITLKAGDVKNITFDTPNPPR